jgi:hypothetical protein
MNRKVYLHIGLPKAGTTTLQIEVFPNFKNVRYLGKFSENMTVLGNRFTPNSLSRFYAFCLHGIQNQESVFKEFNLYLEHTENTIYSGIDNSIPILLSEECFISSFFNPIYRNDRYGYTKPDFQKFIERLISFFDKYNYDLELLFVDRNPKDLLLSMYLEYNWDKKENIMMFFDELLTSSIKQNAYSLELISSENWKKQLSKFDVKFKSFDFDKVFSNNIIQDYFNEESFHLRNKKPLNTTSSKKQYKSKTFLKTIKTIIVLFFRANKQFLLNVKEELAFNKHNKSFEKQYNTLKQDKSFEENLTKIIKNNETT